MSGWRRPRPTVRVRLAALVAAVFLLFGGALLGISYALVRSHLTVDPRRIAEAVEAQGAAGAAVDDARLSRENTYDQFRAIQEDLASDDLEALTVQYLLILAGMTILSGALGWFVAGRALRPTAEITATARRVSQESLHERIALDGPDDELKRLADTFDSMLGRLEAAFERQAAFVANASHELRTPLAVMRTETEVTLADEAGDSEALRRALAVVRDAGARCELLIDALLSLARADRADRPRSIVDITALVRERLLQVPTERLDVQRRLEPVRVIGDRELLRTMVNNLVDNAVHHNVPEGWLAVTTGAVAGQGFLEISNSGARMTRQEAAGLVEAFQRLGTARTGEGLGLGLTIAESIARAHGWEFELEPVEEGGLHVWASFAQASASAPTQPATDAGREASEGVPQVLGID